MTVSEKGNCLAWDCKAYESDMMSYGRVDTPDYIRAAIGLDTQDKCKAATGCYYVEQMLGALANVSTNTAEGVQNA